MTCTHKRTRYTVILRGIPSKPVELFSTSSRKGLLRWVSQLKLENHPLLFIRTFKREGYTVTEYKRWRRYHGGHEQ